MTKPSCLTLAAVGDAIGDERNHAQPLCSVLSITPRLGLRKVLLLGPVALVLQRSLEAPAQVSGVYCVKNHVHLFVCHYMNKLLARTGWGVGRPSAVVGLWDSISCACGRLAAFSL